MRALEEEKKVHLKEVERTGCKVEVSPLQKENEALEKVYEIGIRFPAVFSKILYPFLIETRKFLAIFPFRQWLFYRP